MVGCDKYRSCENCKYILFDSSSHIYGKCRISNKVTHLDSSCDNHRMNSKYIDHMNDIDITNIDITGTCEFCDCYSGGFCRIILQRRTPDEACGCFVPNDDSYRRVVDSPN